MKTRKTKNTSKTGRILKVFGLALIALLGSYIYVNLKCIVQKDKTDLFSRIQCLIEQRFSPEDDNSEVVFVNTSYDQDLADCYHPDDHEYLGRCAVSDRQKLLRFLEKMDSVDSYKYIVMDIRFEAEYVTPYDSALFAKIASMPRIIIPNHSNIHIADSALLPKTALNDYNTTLIVNNFVRYKYIQSDNRPSVALRLYQAMTGSTIKEHCGSLWYSIPGNGLCNNAPFLIIRNTYNEKNPFGEAVESNQWVWQDLSRDILSRPSTYLDTSLFKDKYIFVCDMENDVHDTYAGSIPGSVITYRAFQTLMQGRNIVRWWFALIGFILYGCLFFIILRGRSFFPCIHKSRVLRSLAMIIGSFISYGLALSLIAALCYICLGISINVLVPSVICAILKSISKTSEK